MLRKLADTYGLTMKSIKSELEGYFKVVIDAALGSWNVATYCRYSGLEGLRKNRCKSIGTFGTLGDTSNSVPLAYNSTLTLLEEPHYYSVRSSVTKWLPNFYLVPHLNTLLSQGATYLSLSLSLP